MYESSSKSLFHPLVLEFCDRLSQVLTAYTGPGREEVVSLGFWLRTGNIRQLAKRYEGCARQGLGLAFHIPPANVPTLTVYSWVSAMLAGNENVVRISANRPSNVTGNLLGIIEQILAEKGFEWLRQRNRFVTYGYEEEKTVKWLSKADAALLWGGDGAIHDIQALRSKPAFKERFTKFTRDLCFPNRWSMAIIDTRSLDEHSEGQLANRLWRDTGAFYQQACSSPKAIAWLGEPGHVSNVRKRCWDAYVEKVLDYLTQEGQQFTAATEQEVYRQTLKVLHADAFPSDRGGCFRAWLPRLTDDVMKVHPGYFCFIELVCDDANQLAEQVQVPLQTISYWPHMRDVANDELLQSLSLRQIPLGQSLDFDVIWDGKDLIRELSEPSIG